MPLVPAVARGRFRLASGTPTLARPAKPARSRQSGPLCGCAASMQPWGLSRPSSPSSPWSSNAERARWKAQADSLSGFWLSITAGPDGEVARLIGGEGAVQRRRGRRMSRAADLAAPSRQRGRGARAPAMRSSCEGLRRRATCRPVRSATGDGVARVVDGAGPHVAVEPLVMSGCISVMVRILASQSCPAGPRLPSQPVQPSSPWNSAPATAKPCTRATPSTRGRLGG